MTVEWLSIAEVFQGIADACRRMPTPFPGQNSSPAIDGEAAVGAAMLWAYLRDLFTATPREAWDRGSILVLLDRIANDTELFAPGCIEQIADVYES